MEELDLSQNRGGPRGLKALAERFLFPRTAEPLYATAAEGAAGGGKRRGGRGGPEAGTEAGSEAAGSPGSGGPLGQGRGLGGWSEFIDDSTMLTAGSFGAIPGGGGGGGGGGSPHGHHQGPGSGFGSSESGGTLGGGGSGVGRGRRRAAERPSGASYHHPLGVIQERTLRLKRLRLTQDVGNFTDRGDDLSGVETLAECLVHPDHACVDLGETPRAPRLPPPPLTLLFHSWAKLSLAPSCLDCCASPPPFFFLCVFFSLFVCTLDLVFLGGAALPVLHLRGLPVERSSPEATAAAATFRKGRLAERPDAFADDRAEASKTGTARAREAASGNSGGGGGGGGDSGALARATDPARGGSVGSGSSSGPRGASPSPGKAAKAEAAEQKRRQRRRQRREAAEAGRFPTDLEPPPQVRFSCFHCSSRFAVADLLLERTCVRVVCVCAHHQEKRCAK